MQRINGNRIYLRPFEATDKAAVLAGANEPTGSRLTGTHATFTEEQITQYIQLNISGDNRFAWVICRTDDDTPVGEVVINEIDRTNRSANIRIALFDPQHYGKGYGTEAMRLAVEYGFKEGNLHRIALGVYDFNPRAVRVYEKVGFTLEGTLRDTLFWEGAYHDEYIMSILEDDWNESTPQSK